MSFFGDPEFWLVDEADMFGPLECAPKYLGDPRASEDVEEMGKWWNGLSRIERMNWLDHARDQNPHVEKFLLYEYAWAEYKRINNLEDAYSKESDFDD